MELTAEQLNQLERYLTGEMADDEVSKYEHEIANNVALQNHIEDLGSLDEVLMEDGYLPTKFDGHNKRAKAYFEYMLDEENQAFYKELENIDIVTSKEPIQTPKKSLYRRLSGVAAALVIGLLAFFTLWPKNLNSDKLYAKYSTHQDLPSIIQKTDSGTELSPAEKAFNNKDYTAAIPIFANHLSLNPDDDIVRMYYAFALTENKDLDQAIMQMKVIAENNNSLRQIEAHYHLGLLYVKAGDND